MVNKRGAELSLNFIIIAAIVLVVLIVAILFFTGSTGTILKKQAETGKMSEQEYGIAVAKCRLACATKDQSTFDNPVFSSSLINNGKTKCDDLTEYYGKGGFELLCLGKCYGGTGADKKSGALCSIYTSKDDCPAGCVWSINQPTA